MFTTPFVEDNHFFNTKLKDKINGNDYKEVVNQKGRNWLMDKIIPPRRSQSQPRLITLDDYLKQFNEEENIHSAINLKIREE